MATRVTATTAACESSSVLTAAIVASISYVAFAVPSFVSVEVIECFLAALWRRPYVTVMWIVPVIDMAIEAMPTVEPRTSPNEDATSEPIRPIVAIGSTRVRRVVEVSVRARRLDSDVHGDLSRYGWIADQKHSCGED